MAAESTDCRTDVAGHGASLSRWLGRLSPALTVMLALVGGCGGGDPGPATVYSTGFGGSRASTWLTQTAAEPANCTPLAVRTESSGNQYAVSEGPWWIDPNHASPGLGYLYLVAFAYHHDWSIDGEIPGLAPGLPQDLRDAEITLRWRAPRLVLPLGARLVLWFQAHDPNRPRDDPRYVNYALTKTPLVVQPGNESWQEVKLQLSAEPGTFECLGSNVDRQSTYGCAEELGRALAQWRINLGFIILFEDPGLADAIRGAVEFDHLSIDVPGDRSLSDYTPWSVSRQPRSTCRADQIPTGVRSPWH